MLNEDQSVAVSDIQVGGKMHASIREGNGIYASMHAADDGNHSSCQQDPCLVVSILNESQSLVKSDLGIIGKIQTSISEESVRFASVNAKVGGNY